MQICRVIGSVTATAKDQRLVGLKLLLVQPTRAHPDVANAETFVAVDTVGAGVGDRVVVTFGSAARLTVRTETVPTDAAIIAIVDPDGEFSDPAATISEEKS